MNLCKGTNLKINIHPYYTIITDNHITTLSSNTMDMLPSHDTISVSVGVIVGISVVGGITSAVLIIFAASLVYVLCIPKEVKRDLKGQQRQHLTIGDRPGMEMVSIANSISTEDNVAYAQMNVRVDNDYDTIPPLGDCP